MHELDPSGEALRSEVIKTGTTAAVVDGGFLTIVGGEVAISELLDLQPGFWLGAAAVVATLALYGGATDIFKRNLQFFDAHHRWRQHKLNETPDTF